MGLWSCALAPGKAGGFAPTMWSLTPREHEVMGRVVRGMLNKQIAGEN
jgi:FixJ family two-component response regulator